MADFRERYKKVGFGREDPGINRALRSQRRNDQRREKRSEFYGARRDLGQDDSVELEEEQRKRQAAANNHEENKVEEKIDEACLNRLKQLEKWREERNRRRALEKKVAKPVFKVGVVHHRVYSPPVNKKEAPSPPAKLCKHKENVPEPPPKRVTKATKKRLEIKALTSQQKRENLRSKKKKETVEKVPLGPKDHQFKAPTGVSAIPLFGRKALEPSKENVQLELINDCFPSKADCPVNVSSLCRSITDFTFNLLESSSLPKSQPNEILNESKDEEMDQDNKDEKSEDMDVESDHPSKLNSSPLSESISSKTDNRRRSTRIFNDSMIKKPPTTPKTRKLRIDFNLLDSSLSNLTENGSPNTRRTTRFSKMIHNGIDQSLIKFSPRQSMRLAKEAATSLPSTKIMNSSLPEEIEKPSSPEVTKSSPSEEVPKSSPPEEVAKSSPPEEIASTSFNKTLSPEKPPVFYSPFVVASRGKSSARKELKKSRRSVLATEDIPTKDTVMKNLNISIEEEERTAQYFKYLLNQEIERLNELCDSWEVVKNDETTPEDIHYVIQAAIGQTQLLINKKFKRFQSLVQDCETGRGEMLVTCKDLQGFWEMTYIEVENCDARFKKLEELKANNWVDEEAIEAEKQMKKKPAVKKSAAVKKKPVASKSSSIRALILAARKKKMQDPSDEVEIKIPKIVIQEENDKQAADDNAEKTPARNSRRISTPASKSSLLRKVQLSQTRKSITSPLITMKINKMCRTPEVHLDDSIVYINSDRTPARSILKSCKDDVAMMSAAKSANKVLFKEQPMEVQLIDADLETLDEVPTGKRLNFDDSFDQNESEKEDDDGKQIGNAKSKRDNENNSPVGSKPQFKEEMYLNSQGIVSTRLIPIIEDTPNTLKWKRRNSTKQEESHDLSTPIVAPSTPSSQRRRNSKKLAEGLDLSTAEPVTPNSQRRSLRIRKLYGNKD